MLEDVETEEEEEQKMFRKAWLEKAAIRENDDEMKRKKNVNQEKEDETWKHKKQGHQETLGHKEADYFTNKVNWDL